jgi:hypothetical protein
LCFVLRHLNDSILYWLRMVYCVQKSIIYEMNENVTKIYPKNPKMNFETYALN